MKNSILQPKSTGVYILTNTVNNKQYVGMGSNMLRRFKQHIKGIGRKCPLLHDALSACGLDKWTVQFMAQFFVIVKKLDRSWTKIGQKPGHFE